MGGTNMGAGIELAYKLKDPSRATWIIVMTDGVSNIGAYQTPDSFKELSRRRPLNSRIITLGYGTEFNAEILKNLGEYTQFDNQEQIATVFGSLAFEVMNTWGFNARISILNKPDEYQMLKIVIGQEDIGSLYPDKIFRYGCVFGPTDLKTFKESKD